MPRLNVRKTVVLFGKEKDFGMLGMGWEVFSMYLWFVGPRIYICLKIMPL